MRRRFLRRRRTAAAVQTNRMVVTPVVPFDYATAPPETVAVVRAAADLIRGNQRKYVEAVVAVGQQLISVKMALQHGQFGSWLRAENLFAETTAENYMRVAEKIGSKSATVADLPLALIYRMSSPMVPDETRRHIFARREAGESIDKKAVTELVTTAIWESKTAAVQAAEEARLSPKAKAKQQEDRKKRKLEREASEARWQEQLRREEEAERRAATIIIERFGSDVAVLQAALDEVPTGGFVSVLLRAVEAVRPVNVIDGSSA